MISISTLEYLVILTSVLSTISILFMINDMANLAAKNLIKLKQENKKLEEEIKKTNNSDKNLQEIGISEESKMEILIKENRRLHIRCDMLEEELAKLREIPNKRFTRSQLSKM